MPVQSQHRTRSSSDPFSDPSLSVKLVPSPPSKPKRPSNSRDNTLDALRDTVIVRNHDPPSRTRMARPHTQGSQHSSNGRPSLQLYTPRRSLSQDDSAVVAPPPTEKSKSNKTRMGKKGSQHADVIDRMDFSGVGPMFHHDGPFDACAPSRNRHRTKAPMAAWSLAPDGSNAPPVTTAPPRAQVYKTEQPSKRKVDAIAEAWGIHEPEPYEDFSAGGGDYRHNYSSSNTLARRHDDLPALPPARRQPTRRTTLPPPQPIFVPGPDEEVGGPPSPTSGQPGSPGTGMKRSKSLLHRIRKMRETPNVPVNNSDDQPYDDPPSPNDTNSPRPTHRSQNSFLGRFGRSGNMNGIGTPPADELYVYIEDPKDKELPKPPVESSGTSSENGGYFDSHHESFGGSPSSGVGRKRSLLKKVGKAVKGQK